MSIEIAGKRYPFDQMAIVGARAENAQHPAGTETVELPCSLCGGTMLVDVVKRDLADRTARPFVCLPCARSLAGHALRDTRRRGARRDPQRGLRTGMAWHRPGRRRLTSA